MEHAEEIQANKGELTSRQDNTLDGTQKQRRRARKVGEQRTVAHKPDDLSQCFPVVVPLDALEVNHDDTDQKPMDNATKDICIKERTAGRTHEETQAVAGLGCKVAAVAAVAAGQTDNNSDNTACEEKQLDNEHKLGTSQEVYEDRNSGTEKEDAQTNMADNHKATEAADSEMRDNNEEGQHTRNDEALRQDEVSDARRGGYDNHDIQRTMEDGRMAERTISAGAHETGREDEDKTMEETAGVTVKRARETGHDGSGGEGCDERKRRVRKRD